MDEYEEWRLVFNAGRPTARKVLAELGADLPLDVDVHRRRNELLVYAHSQESIREAERLISRALERHGVVPAPTLAQWNPGAERWQDPSLPVDPPTRRLGAEWAALGELGWEVRLRLQDGKEADRLLRRVIERGLPAIGGIGNRVTVGAEDERAAQQLASELRFSAPTARIEVRRLSRWRRWLIRQHLLGNYSGGTLDFSGGGDGGGNGGG